MQIDNMAPELTAPCLVQLSDLLFRQSAEGVMLTDNQGLILKVNYNFTVITGYSITEVVGKKTAILRSDHHPLNFYQQLWQAITQQGYWQGKLWNRRKDCSVYQQSLKIFAIYDKQQNISHYISLLQDLTSALPAPQHKLTLVTLDPLTGLGNRDMLVSRFSQQLAQSRDAGIQLYVIWIDAGQLAAVNQQYGLTKGDLFIQLQGQRLRQQVAAKDTLIRLYADDFIILRQSADTNIQAFFDSTLQLLAQPLILGEQTLTVAPAIGVSCFPADAEQEEKLLHAAESAMLEAKKRGANCWCMYNNRQAEAGLRRQFLKQKLTEQLQGTVDQLQLYFQAKVDIDTGNICGVEALIRWHIPEIGMVSPTELIAVAEESRLIISLDRWVVTEVCRILSYYQQRNIRFPLTSFNISAKQLNESDFAQWFSECLANWRVGGAQLEMEVTESAFVDNEQEAIKQLRQLQQTGLRIALDDFGTGYSSLSYLKDLPLNTVKIDRSLINDITTNQRAQCIVRNVKSLAADLQLNLVVEGVETVEQHKLLQKLGCQQAQGFYYAKPLPTAQFVAVIS